MKYYKISETVLRELLLQSYLYCALEAGGVDNWEWAGDSIQDFIAGSSNVDGTEYEDMDAIVEADLKNFEEINSPLI